MSKRFVLDSSAVLAVINSEKGGEQVEPKLPDSILSAVNAAEILTKLGERDIEIRDALDHFLDLGLEVVNFDVEQASAVASLRPVTKHLGLALGDRACLALAMRENATAVTADRDWQTLDVCSVEVIR